MGEGQQASGPDLALGIALSELRAGVPVAGHVGEEAVVLVRSGEDVFAIGATCTHYGGPLAEGLVVDRTVRCPWHHACFDLATGEPVRPPALNPVARYRVEVEAGRVRVAEKLPPAPPPPPPAAAPDSVVVGGAGAAGNAAAETLRRESYSGPVTLVGADPSGPYDRPNLSKDYLAGNAPEEWIPLRPPEWYMERGITLMTGAAAAALDPAAKQLTLVDGRVLSYGALVLAPGAEPVPLAIPGSGMPHVHLLRTLAHSRAIIAKAGGAKRAVVVGASFIGLEAAASLRARKLEVHVVAPGGRPLERVLGPEVGDFVRRLHEEHGVVFHLGRRPAAIDERTVTLDDGTSLPADLVVAGIGVKPSVALAERAGLAVDDGILVDEQLRASAPGIWAAGDAARWRDARTGERTRVEHWVVAERMGQRAAENVLGRSRPFDAVPFFWSAHYDVTISYVGRAARWDRVDIHGDLKARDATVAYRSAGRTLAVATVGRDRTSLEAELAFERGDDPALAAFGVTR